MKALMVLGARSISPIRSRNLLLLDDCRSTSTFIVLPPRLTDAACMQGLKFSIYTRSHSIRQDCDQCAGQIRLAFHCQNNDARAVLILSPKFIQAQSHRFQSLLNSQFRIGQFWFNHLLQVITEYKPVMLGLHFPVVENFISSEPVSTATNAELGSPEYVCVIVAYAQNQAQVYLRCQEVADW